MQISLICELMARICQVFDVWSGKTVGAFRGHYEYVRLLLLQLPGPGISISLSLLVHAQDSMSSYDLQL